MGAAAAFNAFKLNIKAKSISKEDHDDMLEFNQIRKPQTRILNFVSNVEQETT